MEIDAETEKLFSKKFSIKYFEKSNKIEHGNMNFSLYEIMIQGKPIDGKIKTDRTVAYPEISSINICAEDKIMFDLQDKVTPLTIIMDEPLYVIKCIFIAFKLFFPCEDVFSFLPIKNESNLSLDAVKQDVKDLYVHIQSPCNNFSFGMKFFAKYKYLPENDEIIWDIDTVYANRETNMFILKDFDHLKPKYLFPVLGAMCYNTFFTELSLSSVDLTPYEKLLERVFKFNKKFKKLYFQGCNLKLSLCMSIAIGLEGQRNLRHLDLSNNEGMCDKGIEIFTPFLKKASRTLEVLKISKCNLTSVSVSRIADAFTHNIKGDEGSFIELRVLDLSNNLLKDNFKDIFYDFLSKCCHLEDLNLSNMNCSIEMIAHYLLLGPVRVLKYVNLSENISPLSSQSCTQWSNFFKEAKSLIRISLSNFKSLHCSITDGLMLGLEDNQTLSLTGVEVVISNSYFNSDNFLRFNDFIYKARSVTYLDISSNGIGMEFLSLLSKLPEFTSLKFLNASNNFGGLKPKEQQIILAQMTAALQLESVNLQELSLSNCNFGTHMSILISELDSLFSLRVLDISGNNIGNVVARTVGRMLTIDKHIKEIMLDNNNISKEIYEEILDGLSGNYTLCIFHVPFADLVKYQPKLVLPIIEKINKHHKKVNKIYQGVSFEDIKAMAFSCIMNQTSENIDKCKTTLQESSNRLKRINTTDESIKDQIDKCLTVSLANVQSMDASKDLITKLNAIYKTSSNESLLTDLRIRKVMEKVSSDVSRLLNEYMGEVVTEMMNEMGQTLPFFLQNNELLRQELNETSRKVMEISPEYLRKLFSRFIEKNLLKKVYETQSNVSNALCDNITDHIITQMNTCDILANRLINLSKTSPQSPKLPGNELSSNDLDKPVIRFTDDKRTEREKMMSTRNSRLSHLAASKARPVSKALKPIMDDMDNQPISLPAKPSKPIRVKPVSLKPSNIKVSPNADDPVTPVESAAQPVTPDSQPSRPVAPSRSKKLLPVAEDVIGKSSSQDSIISANVSSNSAGSKEALVTKKDLTQNMRKQSNESFGSRESVCDSPDVISSLKGRPKPNKNIKPKVISPMIDSVEYNPFGDESLQHFHSTVDCDTDNSTKLPIKKSTPKSKAIDLNNLGKEDISTSDSDVQGKSSHTNVKKKITNKSNFNV